MPSLGDGMSESFGGRHESDVTIKAGCKWKYNGEKGRWEGGRSSLEMKIVGAPFRLFNQLLLQINI